jgi:hypothetical protein
MNIGIVTGIIQDIGETVIMLWYGGVTLGITSKKRHRILLAALLFLGFNLLVQLSSLSNVIIIPVCYLMVWIFGFIWVFEGSISMKLFTACISAFIFTFTILMAYIIAKLLRWPINPKYIFELPDQWPFTIFYLSVSALLLWALTKAKRYPLFYSYAYRVFIL